MIYLCPFCGDQLGQGLCDGIADCSHCHRVFNSSKYHQLLAASWVLRKCPQADVEQLAHSTKLSSEDALFVYTWVGQELYTHDDFQAHLKKLGVSAKFTP